MQDFFVKTKLTAFHTTENITYFRYLLLVKNCSGHLVKPLEIIQCDIPGTSEMIAQVQSLCCNRVQWSKVFQGKQGPFLKIVQNEMPRETTAVFEIQIYLKNLTVEHRLKLLVNDCVHVGEYLRALPPFGVDDDVISAQFINICDFCNIMCPPTSPDPTPPPNPTPPPPPDPTPPPTPDPTPPPTPDPTPPPTPDPTPPPTPDPTPPPTPEPSEPDLPEIPTGNSRNRFQRPIPLGISGYNGLEISSRSCSSGTLGSLVTKGGNYFILTNAHVIASDSIPGSNNHVASVGDPILQPGGVETNCNFIASDRVATLSEWEDLQLTLPARTRTIRFDAAIAQVTPGRVRLDGAILNIGVINPNPIINPGSLLNLQVQKNGRTTNRTNGRIDAVNVTINVQYNTPDSTINQIRRVPNNIRIRGAGFSAGGDSGSLVVTNETNPRPVGLLFAGNSLSTFANQLGPIMNAFGINFVGTATQQTHSLHSDPLVQTCTKCVNNHCDSLMKVFPMINGVGVSPGGKIVVYLEKSDKATVQNLPKVLDGLPVVTEVIGTIHFF